MVRTRKAGTTPDLDAVAEFGRAAEPDRNHKNPHAPRNFKAVRLPFNEYEWDTLEEGCAITGRSKLNLLRKALIEYVAAQRDPP
jgi:hypothetical protein